MKYRYTGENEVAIPQVGVRVNKNDTFETDLELNNPLIEKVEDKESEE